MPLLLAKLPLVLHIAAETGAANSFLRNPRTQLRIRGADHADVQREADLVCANLGGALLTTNLVALVVLLRQADAAQALDETSRLIVLALASYHIFPMYRAFARLTSPGAALKYQDVPMGGPAVHLLVHWVCFASLLCSALFGG
ncbi:hypothetical protein MCOR27_004687 [Pyricularia oryzae]|uniref:Uncharacterized protein n=5 Tax=Pyricularia TaxID=48558 RepID=A0ABQ8NUM4_PYRGI|nr:uncharacterized protein MGG_04642 [Pyricularia oryzae 70-15]ELQ37098.1 hypothetical protein OOU_Y34scaffold00619g72 [Pyricularia oryzae Y34]KAH8837437.1 hypothetical protein MCOR01_011057 [Pyricularia oryzae]KAI6302292.1 hypothetical protein MCOR33_002321 [Pyricularia grisea]EHA53826.1 hypothetical protein MGG_04642 [Pyricularia oryzae 70-15]KAH9437879.1 hypothetical protein MCOR02_001524 [Pyricularia oryzae]